MDPDVLITGWIVATSVLSVACIGFAVAWVRARERAIRSERELPAIADAHERRFDRIEQSLDGIATELERVAEMERFSTKLLAEGQLERGASQARERSEGGLINTPH